MSVRHFLTVGDLSVDEFEQVLHDAAVWKRNPAGDVLAGKTVALLFSKPSTRTRVSFSVAVTELGGTALDLSGQELHLGKSESIADTARVLSRYVDAVVIRTFAQHDVEEFARHATVPVINGLTDEEHPCQGLTDIFTFRERFPTWRGRKITYLGDGNNVAVSLAEAALMAGVNMCLSVPEGCDLPSAKLAVLEKIAKRAGARVWVERDPKQAVVDASALYTDVWISMGQSHHEKKLAALQPYQLNTGLLALARPDAIVMHCLPAHRGQEITDEVMDGPQSVVFDQAENRLHVQKALLAFLLKGASA